MSFGRPEKPLDTEALLREGDTHMSVSTMGQSHEASKRPFFNTWPFPSAKATPIALWL